MSTQIITPPILVGELSRISVGETWANIISGAGTGATGGGTIGIDIESALGANLWTVNERSIFIFDTSILATFGTTILTAARLRLNVTFKFKTFAFNPDFNIYGSTPASDYYPLLPADYQRIGNIPYCDTPLPYNLTVIGWNTFTLNTTGLAAIKKSGHTRFGIRNADYDVAAISPAWAALKAVSIAIDGAGFLNPPILEVDFIVKPINSFIKKKIFTAGQI
jgi:hypothetical protein